MLRGFLAFLFLIAMPSIAWAQDETLPPLGPPPSASPTPPPAPTPPPHGTPAPNHHWEVQIGNADDQVFVECNGRIMNPVANFGQSVRVDLTSCLVPGYRNDIYVKVRNVTGAIAWGWQFYKDGQPAITESGRPASGGCGTSGRIGCNNNQTYPAGIVDQKHYWFKY